MIVGNYNVKKVERQSASTYIAWDITWTLCNTCNPSFYGRIKCAPGMGHIRQKTTLLKLVV